MRAVFAALVSVAILIGCYQPYSTASSDSSTSTSSTATASPKVTFEEVSQPYLDQYGQPEDVNKYDSGDYHTVDWWWWTKGFEVSFIDSPYDKVNGWAVDSTYQFSPIS